MFSNLFGNHRRDRPAQAESSRLSEPMTGLIASDGAMSQLPDDEDDEATRPFGTPAPAQGPVHIERALLADDEREALSSLSLLHGPRERKAQVLALMLTPRSHREKQAWREETAELASAEDIRALVRRLGPAARLPQWERVLRETAGAPIGERRELLAGARRVMVADGHVRALDRLRWLAMRHLLGENVVRPTMTPSEVSDGDLTQLPELRRRDVATLTAFLARLVPAPEAGDALVGAAGHAWYGQAMVRLWPAGDAPACKVPDSDALVAGLRGVQTLSWMLRPALVRGWVGAAVPVSEGGRLQADAADGLRLACLLLDTPMPPELSCCFADDAQPELFK